MLISKSGKTLSLDNQRVISLTSCLGQLLEKVIVRAILALDLTKALDNVLPDFILRNLADTNCGERMSIGMWNRFRPSWGTVESDPVLTNRGTPRGSNLSSELLNLAMKNLPRERNRINGIKHSIYADDITIRTTRDFLCEVVERLQAAARATPEYATAGGLSYSAEKSELLLVRKQPEQNTQPNLHIETES